MGRSTINVFSRIMSMQYKISVCVCEREEEERKCCQTKRKKRERNVHKGGGVEDDYVMVI